MSIQIIEIRQFQGPATVELSGVGVPEIVEVRQGPAGTNGPNSVTSATTSDGTCDLSVLTLGATQGISAGFDPTIGRSITANGSDGTGIYVSATSGTGLVIEVDTGVAFRVTSNTGNDIATFRDGLNNGLNIENPRGWIAWVYEPGDIYLGRLKTADITANQDWTLPDRTGNIALTEDYTAGTATIDVLNATVQGTLTANHIHGNIAGSVYAHVRAGENLAKGDPVYVSGSHGSGASLIAIVSKADASDPLKMPAVGVMDAAVSANANGHMVITGTISDIDTNAYAVNSVLYVASGGGFTTTPPAANSQPVAIVERSNTNNGAVIVKVNGLASSGGNGASDANKLARFSSTGTLPISNIGGLGANVATFLATPTSANLAAAVTGETGTGVLVFANSPTFTGTPLIGTQIILSENGFQRAFLSSDYTVATTNTANKIPSFSISVESGKTYKLEIMLKVTGVAGSTHNSQLIGSFNLTAANSSMLYRRAGFETENIVSVSTPFAGFSLFSSTGTSSQICFIDGIIKPTSSGVLEVILHSGSATNSVTMLKGAYMEATLLD